MPATDKSTEQGANDKYHYGVSEMQGWRISMEDAHTTVLNLDEDSPDPNTFFAVYDGHGGYAVAKYAGQFVHKRLIQDEAYHKKDYALALKNAFLGTDADMKSSPEFTREPSGCTAVAALVTNDGRILVANAGDSRSVIGVKGDAKPLSYDHKPQNEKEKSRIVAAGGYIEYGRVNGNLALARALGDFEYKKNNSLSAEAQIITCDPEIIEHQVTEEDEFLIIACDGIWDCLSSQQAVNVVRLLISQGRRLPQVCEDICELCLAPDTASGAGIGCDNMTIMIVAILNGKSQDQWYNWVTDRVKNKIGFQTPESLPQLYSTSRLMSFNVKREAYEKRLKERREREERDRENGITSVGEGSATSLFGGFANILSGDGSLVLHHSDVDDGDDSDDDDIESHGISSAGFLGAAGIDVTKNLREQLQELDQMGASPDHDVNMNDIEDEESGQEDGMHHDGDGEQDPESPSYTLKSSANGISSSGLSTLGSRGGETPPPPPTPPNGNAAVPAQLKHLPDGDAPSAAVKAEGLMDSSESPLKV
ncbi:PP2C-domain-containing protein [Epithele typhae]|uniref:PP2C-domain-containing protein n=1 Tax=Epithele typhae TaxID=378194 RepID=UPI002008C392|nr:PP2C-domain-containing protein [Epithele typhae]KAH9922773.1 PP2C-domain-containing protein [Epithele typhae]